MIIEEITGFRLTFTHLFYCLLFQFTDFLINDFNSGVHFAHLNIGVIHVFLCGDTLDQQGR